VAFIVYEAVIKSAPLLGAAGVAMRPFRRGWSARSARCSTRFRRVATRHWHT